MAIVELTDAQRQSVLQGEAVRLTLPERGEEIVVMRADAYEEIREILEDERQRLAIAKVAAPNVARRSLDDDEQ
jgi:hypothetical protein